VLTVYLVSDDDKAYQALKPESVCEDHNPFGYVQPVKSKFVSVHAYLTYDWSIGKTPIAGAGATASKRNDSVLIKGPSIRGLWFQNSVDGREFIARRDGSCNCEGGQHTLE